jgi:amino acid transporter
MRLFDLVAGKALATSEERAEHIGPISGIPVFGLDALSSAAYGPEAALTLLIPLGMAGIAHIVPISFAIIALLAIVYFSYCQTIDAYPNGGGSYTVASENLGEIPGLLAAAAPIEAAHIPIPELVFVTSPYRFVLMPLVNHILQVEHDHPERQIAVLVPELVVKHWWQSPLHNQRAQLLKLLLLVRGNQRITVINIPWYL